MRKVNSIILVSVCISLFACMGGKTSAAAGKVPTARAVLENMQNALSEMAAAEFEFGFKAFNESGAVLADESGSFVAQGECFRLTTGAVEVFCDGKTKWVYDVNNGEITVFPHDPMSADPAENPFAALKNADADKYTFRRGVEARQSDGHLLYSFSMVSKDSKASYTELGISVDASTWLPADVQYVSRNGDVYSLHVISAMPTDRKGMEYFVPSADLLEDPDIWVTDMRQ